jgi:hypothetical protein
MGVVVVPKGYLHSFAQFCRGLTVNPDGNADTSTSGSALEAGFPASGLLADNAESTAAMPR